MDLFSAHRSASWHPLTSLLAIQSDARNRHLYLVPALDYPDRRELSTFMHEVAHAWTARTTRLGFALAHFGARLFREWATGTVPTVTPALAVLLGAYLPLMEGIALFAELDFESDTPDEPVPTPLTIVGQYYTTFGALSPRSGRLRDVYRLLRVELQGVEPSDWSNAGDNRPNAADLLFLTDDRDDLSHYFAGYCYVKAVWAWFRSVDPRYSNPALFLPVLVRAIADHPVIDHLVDSPGAPGSATDLVLAVHSSLTEIAARHLGAIADLFAAAPAHRERFDLWDPYGQIGSGQWLCPVEHGAAGMGRYAPIDPNGDPLTPADEPFVDTFCVFRAQTSAPLLSWKSGVVESVTERQLLLREAPDVLTEVAFVPMGGLAPDARTADWIHEMQSAWFQFLQERVGATAEVGLFVGLADGTLGAAAWADGRLGCWYPFTSGPFRRPDVLESLHRAVRIPPSERERFGQSLRGTARVNAATADATEAILSLLVSAPDARAAVARGRFRALGGYARDVRRWGYFAFPGHRPALPDGFLAAGRQVFDFPGFSPGRVAFPDLLPILDPDTTFGAP